MDATGCPGPAQAAPAGCAPSCAAATALLGIPGLVVTSVTVTGDGWTVADVITGPAAEAARCCPKGSHNNYFGSSGRVAGSAGVARIV